MKRICIIWARFGPYHLARLRGAHAFFTRLGIEVVGIEVATKDALYAWRIEQDDKSFRREVVFPGQVFEEIQPKVMYKGVLNLLERLQPDAVATNSYSTPEAQAGLTWCRRNKKIAIIMTDSKRNDAPRVVWREYLKRHLVSNFDAALVSGQEANDYIQELGFPSDFIYEPFDVIDNEWFTTNADAIRANPSQASHLPGLDITSPFFLSCNRFLPYKNLDGLLQAYKKYCANVDVPWRLLLVGDGPDRTRLEQLVSALRIGGVTFCGFQQIEALPAYYGLAGAFVHPSFKDTWGLVVNEAMAARLPVLVSQRAGCCRELVLEGVTGYSFDPSDNDSLAKHLEVMSTNPELRQRLSSASFDRIQSFSPEHFSRAMWNCIQTGSKRSHRAMSLFVSLMLWRLSNSISISEFHSVKEN